MIQNFGVSMIFLKKKKKFSKDALIKSESEGIYNVTKYFHFK